MIKIKKFVAGAMIVAGGMTMTACSSDADVVSKNISKDSDNFKVDRRIAFINGITNDNLLTIEGKCSIKDEDRQLEVTCKTGDDDYKKHFLGKSDNVFYIVEQLQGAYASKYHYKVNIKPQEIVPSFELR